jgi:hypothetical protein
VDRDNSRQVAKLLPLIDGEDPANGEKHLGIRLFQVGSSLRYLVDLGNHLRLVGLISFNQGLQDGFLLFQGGVEINEVEAVSLEDFLDLLDLFIANPDLPHQLGVFPPFPGTRNPENFAGSTITGSGHHYSRAHLGAWPLRRWRGLLGDGQPAEHD